MIHVSLAGLSALLLVLFAGIACKQSAPAAQEQRTAASTGTPEPSFATVIIDFSQSFAPLKQDDRLALREAVRGLADLAIQEWNPPTTIVWRKIGVESTTAAPLCNTFEYNRKIIGAVTAADDLRRDLDSCVEKVVQDSRVHGTPEPYTDIGDAIMIASQNWISLPGQKVIIVLSDFLEDLPKGRPPTPISLHGERILMLHRPGTTEAYDTAVYLNRILAWKRRLLASGAGSVAALPVFRASLYAVEDGLSQRPHAGTFISLISDLVGLAPDQEMTRAVSELSRAIAKDAASWPAPVTAAWFGATRPAFRTKSVAPILYIPRMAQRADEVNTTEKFRKEIEQFGFAIQQQPGLGSGDIDGVLRLIGDDESATTRLLVLLSDFGGEPPSTSNPSLRGERVLMVYRAATARSGSGAKFFERTTKWEQYFKTSGASNVCTLDMRTLTESTISMCLQRGY